MMVTYHIALLSTDYLDNELTKFYLGFSYAGVVILMFTINITLMLLDTLKDMIKSCRRDKYQRTKEEIKKKIEEFKKKMGKTKEKKDIRLKIL